MALIERDRNNLTDALERSEEATTLLESLRTGVASRQLRTSYFASHENFYELNIDLNMLSARRDQSTQHLATAFAASEKSRARSLIDALTEARADVSEGVSPELVSLKRALEFRLRAKLEAQTILLSSKFQQSEREAISKEVSDLIRQQEEVSGRIRSSNPKYSQLIQPQPLTLVEIQHQLDDNTILLEYALGKERSYVWLVSPNSINGFELASRDQIESVARRVTDALTARNRQERNETFRQALLRFEKAEKDYTEASASLSKMILDPVASLLGKKRVVVVADGALQMIPFAALPLSESSTAAQSTMRQAESSNAHPAPIGARALISEHEIISLLSASVLALQRQELANRKTAPYAVAVLADPVFDFQDARVAKATGSGNQPRKNVTATGQGGDGKKENKFELSTSPSATNPNAALASALRDIGLNEDGKLPRLTHSLQEARAIARAVPADQSFTALGFKASRETAISPELSKYRIIHFATHGVLDLEHPDLSGIVLSLVNEKGQPQDGYLRLHDIYNLNLPAELVVLSACQTGIGKQVKGEGLIALTRGFMYAGAKSVVASLWKVDDAATSALMADFYKQMFTNKLKPAAALRAAQLNLSQQKRWSSPYYWAGFFIQGEWN
jgi:CHAT domain-containing protein